MLLPAVVPLGLRLPGDGVHDGVLRVHADGRVVLSVDDGGLPSRTLHLDGLLDVLQDAGAEARTNGWRDVRMEEEDTGGGTVRMEEEDTGGGGYKKTQVEVGGRRWFEDTGGGG